MGPESTAEINEEGMKASPVSTTDQSHQRWMKDGNSTQLPKKPAENNRLPMRPTR